MIEQQMPLFLAEVRHQLRHLFWSGRCQIEAEFEYVSIEHISYAVAVSADGEPLFRAHRASQLHDGIDRHLDAGGSAGVGETEQELPKSALQFLALPSKHLRAELISCCHGSPNFGCGTSPIAEFKLHVGDL